MPHSDPPSPSRRDFLSTVGLSALGAAFPATAGAAAAGAAVPADPRRDVHASQADLGTLFPEAERIAEGNRFAYSYLNGRFSSWPAFQAEARAKLLELLLYQPAPVDPRPEVQERVDCGTYFRERITFATAPGLR